MKNEMLSIPFPPKDYPCRDGKEIKTWMDGYEAAIIDLKVDVELCNNCDIPLERVEIKRGTCDKCENKIMID